jgi:dTDP-4-amino-4,6-dideoxygalactose transaminase
MNVPAFDLRRAVQRVADPVAARWKTIHENTSFVLGPEVREFEEAFARYLGATGVIGAANGTDALVVALRALGAAAGDEILVPAFSFFATAEAVVLVGAKPVFVDVDPATLNLDFAAARAAVTSRTVGVIGVHLYGRPFDVAAAQALCSREALWLIEDSAQAHGAQVGAKRVGTFGELSAWSFYPTKNLGCFGDGGGLSGMDAELLTTARRIANHGQVARYQHVAVGVNSRLDSLQAAVLNCRLPLLEADNDRRRAVAARYREAFAGLDDLRLPEDPAGTTCVYHQMTVMTSRREELMAHLTSAGVGHSIHYPSPLHRQEALREAIGTVPDLPVAERAAREVLCLPMFPEITDAEVDRAAEAVRSFFSS